MTDAAPAGPAVPEADRPRMFGRKGLDPALLPWSWAEHRLIEARNYWIATTRPDGRPHTRPVWGVWHEGAFHFSTGSAAEANLAVSDAITVHLESGDEAVIVESTARPLNDPAALRAVIAAYNAKYHGDLDPDQAKPWYTVRPVRVFGWVSDPSGRDGAAAFCGTVTRWTFGP